MADTLTGFNRYVFVYGTLRSGEARDINLLLPTPFFAGYGKTCGVLYDLGAYPGVRLEGGQWVYGEVYRIAPELERQLDAIEEVWPQQTGEYTRQEVAVQLCSPTVASVATDVLGILGISGSGPEQTCLVYEISKRRTAGKPVIGSGDWLLR